MTRNARQTAVAILAGLSIIGGTTAAAAVVSPTLAHADVAHVGTALVSTSPGESVEISTPTYQLRAPRVLRPFGRAGSRYVATPEYARRLPAHACVSQTLRQAYATSDVAVVTDGGVQLAQDYPRTGDQPDRFRNVVNGTPTRVVATYDGIMFCNRSSVAMWAMGWRG